MTRRVVTGRRVVAVRRVVGDAVVSAAVVSVLLEVETTADVVIRFVVVDSSAVVCVVEACWVVEVAASVVLPWTSTSVGPLLSSPKAASTPRPTRLISPRKITESRAVLARRERTFSNTGLPVCLTINAVRRLGAKFSGGVTLC